MKWYHRSMKASAPQLKCQLEYHLFERKYQKEGGKSGELDLTFQFSKAFSLSDKNQIVPTIWVKTL